MNGSRRYSTLFDEKSSGKHWPLLPSDLLEIVTAANRDLESLRSARIFITGGTGYIGRWILETIRYANTKLELGVSAVVLSREPEAFRQIHPELAQCPNFEFVKGDVRTFREPGGEFSHVIHGATDVATSCDPLDLFSVTLNGTARVLEFARMHSASRTLILSSGAVYGAYADTYLRVPESHRSTVNISSVNSAYALGKIASEWLGYALADRGAAHCSSARIFAQVGPGLALSGHYAAGNFIRDALQGRSVVIQGEGSAVRSYMYPTDLVVWLLAILVRGRSGQAYNVGSEEAVSIRQLAETVSATATSGRSDVEVRGLHRSGAAPEVYVPDTSLARTEFGVAVTVPLSESLGRTIRWYSQQFEGRLTS